MNVGFLAQQTIYGAIAAAGFGVLFNVGFRFLGWCAASGAVAVAVRTTCLGMGWNLAGASFAAALTVSIAVQLLAASTKVSTNALDVVGCIPLVPGSLAAKAIVGLFALTTGSMTDSSDLLNRAVRYTLGVLFTTVTIGTGLAIPQLLMRARLGGQSWRRRFDSDNRTR
jgi:uncharacterized membrane protein YjjB (DUF3815 family)